MDDRAAARGCRSCQPMERAAKNMNPTEADIRAYELRVSQRDQRRQARRPALIAFRNLFGLMALGAVIYGATAFWMTIEIAQDCGNSASSCNENPPMAWSNPAAIYAILAYIALVALILVVKNSQGHKIRVIARTRRAALYPGHPWVQYRIRHPYWSHVVLIGGMLTALNIMNGLTGRRGRR
jgi:hypothetical protein